MPYLSQLLVKGCRSYMTIDNLLTNKKYINIIANLSVFIINDTILIVLDEPYAKLLLAHLNFSVLFLIWICTPYPILCEW